MIPLLCQLSYAATFIARSKKYKDTVLMSSRNTPMANLDSYVFMNVDSNICKLIKAIKLRITRIHQVAGRELKKCPSGRRLSPFRLVLSRRPVAVLFELGLTPADRFEAIDNYPVMRYTDIWKLS